MLKTMLRLENAFHECRLGVSTRGVSGFGPGDWSKKEHTYYLTVSYRGIFHILDSLHLRSSDAVVDLGCGKGRVVCCALQYGVEAIGVEDVEPLCLAAQTNLRQMRLKTKARGTIIHGKAEEFDYSRGTVFYMFHPFGPNTLRVVLSRINDSIQNTQREVKIIYVNPKHDLILERESWLGRYEWWPPSRCIGYPVSFWRSQQIKDRRQAAPPHESTICASAHTHKSP